MNHAHKLARAVAKSASVRRLYYRLQLARSKGQSDETEILARLSAQAPRTFVEFGFHPVQFNCAALARSSEWSGLLIDGSAKQVADARSLLSARIEVVERFLTLENLDLIRSFFPSLGVLSIDVDGNDYWFLKALIETRPAVICVEYNSTFGLEPVTVPYDPAFDRHEKHPSGWYHGASLSALSKLCETHGYGLAAVSEAGANAFFTEGGYLDPDEAWRPSALRLQYSDVGHADQWQAIRHLPLISV